MKLREELCKSMGCAWIAAGVAAADLWLKKRAERRKESSRNRGAFLNLGQERPELVRALSAGLTALVSALFLRTPFRKGSRLKKAGLALLLGGAVSNTYDRIKRGYVVDYIRLRTGIPAVDRVVFNLADFAVFLGSLLTALGA
ncbi:MAG TPA: signal peptidase II [Candidatus Eisenbergiella merdigallinarum]|uniref:Signal peptidase II n=1 Tax=Candidatus Eisenbergiella merdigallinarum TaxID=2838552 RepID=A0A9D2MU50_9FIRM|nr:signal peptidase II [Candidatus Eisenbergiella merdigallinarum]